MGIADPMFTGDEQRRLAEVERQLRNLTSGRRLEDASIGARGLRLLDGGSITIEGGQFRLNDSSGVTVAYFGDVDAGSNRTRGWIFRFDSAALAFALGGEPGRQTWGLRDRAENVLVSNDEDGTGLSRPYLNIPLYASSGTSVGTGGPFWPQFTNVAYQEVMHGITTLWHPRIRVGVATNNGGSGTVEWELRIDGTTIGTGSGSGFGTFDVNGWGTDNKPGDQVSVQLWCRNTSGSASRVIPDYCYGLES